MALTPGTAPSGSSSTASAQLTRGVVVQPTAIRTATGLATVMAALSVPAFGQLTGTPGYQVIVQSGEKFQPFYGAGAAISDSAAYCFTNYLTATQRSALFQEMFGTNNLSTLRIGFGATDFSSVAAYTYDDVASDTGLTNFSIGQDTKYIIPILHQILAVNPKVRIIASLWSPPAWMKTGTSQTLNGGTMNATAANLTTLAQYFVKAIQAYAALGVPIWAVTPQNEPAESQSYPSCQWAAADLATFVGTYLGPAFDTAGLTTKILVGDDFWSQSQFAATCLASSTAFPYIEGSAWHGYGGVPLNQLQTMRPYPSKTTHFTEYRTLSSQSLTTSMQIMAGDVAIGSIRDGASSITLWNFALDQNGAPYTVNTGRRGVVTIMNDGSGTITRNTEYYMLAHIAKYVQPGAFRCKCNTFALGSSGTDVEAVSFINPDSSIVLFLYNAASASRVVTVTDSVTSLSSPVTLQSGDMVTMTWGPSSASATASTFTAPTAPLSLTAIGSASSVALAWSAPSSTGTTALGGYRVIRGTATGTETLVLGEVAPTVTSFSDTAITAGTTYYYEVLAYGGGGVSPASNEASATASSTPAALSITGTPPSSATVGTAYSFTPTTSGGTAPYTYALTGTLPAGLSFSTSTGAISGTPTTVGTASGLNITVTDSESTPVSASLGTFSIAVAAAAAAGSNPLTQDATSNANSAGSTTSLTWNHTVGSTANLLVVALAFTVGGTGADYPSVDSVTAGGVAMTKIGRAVSTGNIGYERATELWSLQNPPTGAVSIVASTPPGMNGAQQEGNAPNVSAAAVSYINALSSPFGTFQTASTANTSTTTLSVTSTTTNARGIVLSAGAVRSTSAPTIGSGETSIYASLNGTNLETAVSTQPGSTSGATSSLTWTTADQAALIAVPINSN